MDHEELIESIKAGRMKFTKKNLKLVETAWATTIVLDDAIKQAGLDELPDPENTNEHQQIFENWLVEAFSPKFGSEDARRRFHWVRDEILKQEHLKD